MGPAPKASHNFKTTVSVPTGVGVGAVGGHGGGVGAVGGGHAAGGGEADLSRHIDPESPAYRACRDHRLVSKVVVEEKEQQLLVKAETIQVTHVAHTAPLARPTPCHTNYPFHSSRMPRHFTPPTSTTPHPHHATPPYNRQSKPLPTTLQNPIMYI